MKQRYLLNHLRQQGCPLLREGVEHSILENNDLTAAGIGRPLGAPFPSI